MSTLVIPGGRVRVVPVQGHDVKYAEYAVYVDNRPAQAIYSTRERADYFALGFAAALEYVDRQAAERVREGRP